MGLMVPIESNNPYKFTKEQLGDETFFNAWRNIFKISIGILISIQIGAVSGFHNFLSDLEKKHQNEINNLDSEKKEKYSKLLQKADECTSVKDSKEAEEEAGDETVITFVKQLKIIQSSKQGEHFLLDMILVSLVAIFETYLERSLCSLFETDLRILLGNLSSDKDKTITYKDLIDNIDEIKKHIAEIESKKIVSKGVEEIARFIKKNLDLDLIADSYWKTFKECFYRRHVIIHNDGFSDKEYCKNTGYGNMRQRLYIDEEYLSSSINIFLKYVDFITNSLNTKFGNKQS